MRRPDLQRFMAVSVALLLVQCGVMPSQDCNAVNQRPTWRRKLPDGSLFFPYAWCLAFKVLSVRPHVRQGKMDTADLEVEVKVEYVLRDGTRYSESTEYNRFDNRRQITIRPGDTITLCLSKGLKSDLMQYIDSLKGTTQVWAFSGWSQEKQLHFGFEDHFEPFNNRKFQTRELAELADDLEKVITDPQKARLPIERYLTERWTEKRIQDFCHGQNRLANCLPVPEPGWFKCEDKADDFHLKGSLYLDSELGEVMWFAFTANKVPIRYGLIVKCGKNIWQLERAYFQLGSSFSDDDALKKRIYDTLNEACHQSFMAHLRPPETKEEKMKSAIFSTTPLRLSEDWRTFNIERDESGKVVAVNSETTAGQLRVLLNANVEIQTVTVNGKVDDEWVESLAAANAVRVKRYGQ